MVSIDYCILTMEIMEIYHLNGHQTTILKYGNGKGILIFFQLLVYTENITKNK
jgi:hypothetical protein